MWPDIEKTFTQKELDELYRNFSADLDVFIKKEKIQADFESAFKSIYLPLAKWIANKHSNEPVIIGINGAQGSGKSTLSKLLAMLLQNIFRKNVLLLSIDDLYLSQNQRLSLANKIHPLFKIRGVPGTHNVNLGGHILNSIKSSKKEKIKLPVFDKATDDLVEEEKWPLIKDNIDILLFEGWCVGARPQSDKSLCMAVNELEEKFDADRIWRNYINQQLTKQYKKLFSYIDYLIMLEVPNMDSVYEWRRLQESKLRKQNRELKNTKNKIMTDKELAQFLMHFERITRSCLNEMPQRADILLKINQAHQVESVQLR